MFAVTSAPIDIGAKGVICPLHIDIQFSSFCGKFCGSNLASKFFSNMNIHGR